MRFLFLMFFSISAFADMVVPEKDIVIENYVPQYKDYPEFICQKNQEEMLGKNEYLVSSNGYFADESTARIFTEKSVLNLYRSKKGVLSTSGVLDFLTNKQCMEVALKDGNPYYKVYHFVSFKD
jgi:hypothetical protein